MGDQVACVDTMQVCDRGGSEVPWQHLAMTREGPPLLFAGSIDGTVTLFDLRQHDGDAAARVHLHDGPMVKLLPCRTLQQDRDRHNQTPACTVDPPNAPDCSSTLFIVQAHRCLALCLSQSHIGYRQSLTPWLLLQVGMALGPGDWDSQLVTAACGGDMKYTDFRLLPGEEGRAPSAQMGVWKSLHAEDRGPVSAFAAHPHAPLLATASLSQNVQASGRASVQASTGQCSCLCARIAWLRSQACLTANMLRCDADGQVVGATWGHAGISAQFCRRGCASAVGGRQPHCLAPLQAHLCMWRC
jgi:hypothetical protein